jgi:hypothetical protein
VDGPPKESRVNDYEFLREDDEPEVQADEGRAQVPSHPAEIAPSPGTMKSAYLKALEVLSRSWLELKVA